MSSRSKKAKETLHLKISPLSPFQFVNHFFDVMIWIHDDSDKMRTGGEDIPLRLSLAFEDLPPGGPRDDLLEVDPDTPPVIRNGRANIRVRITDVSMNEGNRRFCIHVVPEPPSTITAAKSVGITVITHKLVLEPSPWEDEWFKDEGGRDKCITLRVSLRDARGKVVSDRRVPLIVTLMYNNDVQVARQDILKIAPDSELVIEGGKAEIKARIDEVSRSHQNQPFKVRVGPQVESNPLDNDISPVSSLPVTVRSKRNNKTRKRKATDTTADASRQSYPYDRQSPVSATPASSPPLSFQRPSISPPSSGGGSNGNMQDALTNLLAWISDVLGVFQSMKWKPIGVEMIEGTAVDRSRGVYEMRNPNADIDKVLTKYKHEVMQDLHLILSKVEPILDTATASSTPSPVSTAAAVEDRPPPPSHMTAMGSLSDLPEFPPTMNRQVSSQYILGDGAQPESSRMSNLPYADLTFSGDTSQVENRIFYVIAKVFIHANSKIGFPAFDKNRNLLGFYREREGDGARTEVFFIPLESVRDDIGMTDANIKHGASALNREIEKGSQSVFHLSNCENSLEKVKEAVFVYYWVKQSTEGTDYDEFTQEMGAFFEL